MKKMFSCLLAIVMLVALAVPVAAVTPGFVPSVEIKPGPSIVPQPGDDGTPSYGVIVMPDGTEIPLPEGAIIITPISGKDDADEDTKKALEDAFQDLVDGFEDLLDKLVPGTTPDDIVITDIFHVDVTDDFNDFLDEGGKLKVTIAPGSDIVNALKEYKDAWTALLGNELVDNGDGTFTLIIDKNSVIALTKDVTNVDVDPENPGVSSPTTGEEEAVMAVVAVEPTMPTVNHDYSVLLLIGGVLFAGAAVALVIFACKKKA